MADCGGTGPAALDLGRRKLGEDWPAESVDQIEAFFRAPPVERLHDGGTDEPRVHAALDEIARVRAPPSPPPIARRERAIPFFGSNAAGSAWTPRAYAAWKAASLPKVVVVHGEQAVARISMRAARVEHRCSPRDRAPCGSVSSSAQAIRSFGNAGARRPSGCPIDAALRRRTRRSQST